ncbi:MAG: putative membrane protein [Candidatus Woesebacteria bacterium GW2011_GWA1_38_8]|uniref:Putative membrane protein n=1 Tax=Candidatus Woesebacteria bacterium GW2011_GWA1_38_8 TaxID=1618547 RepID=A0A0G0KXL1_9BACT|nr:MAG: putative membrane protein [Candidatus Woesebacteria bacterium GW2011_GWA1_38_8]
MKSLFQRFWPQLIIVALWLIFSSPYFLKGLVPFPSDYLVTFFPPWSAEYGMPVKNNAMPDVITQIFPWKKLTIETWKSGAIPLWNPYSFSGTPHAGNYQSAVFSPINLLFFVLPFIDAWSILILLQPLLAGLLMYLFVRSLDRSKEASLLASTAFMFCGFMVVWMAYGTLGYAALFLPLIFWGINKRSGLAISLGIALSLLSGHFQVSVYVVIASLAYILWRRKWPLMLFLVIGILIAAPQILLGFKSFLLSTRGETIVKGEIIPWQYLLTFIAPDFFGNPVTRNDWFGHYAEWAGFIGVIPLMLALFSIRKKLAEGWFFVILAAVTLLFALPTPLNNLLYALKIPVLSGSAASRIIILTSFSLATIAGYGVDALKDKKNSFLFSLASISFVAVIWIVLLFGKPLPVDTLAIARHNFILPSVLVVLASAAFVLRKKFVIYILIALAAADVLRFAIKWMPFEERQYVYPEIKSLTYLSTHVGNDRVFGNIGSGEVGVKFGIPLVEGYDAVYQSRYGEFMSVVSKGHVYPPERSVVQFDKYGVYKTEALQLLGIRYIYHRWSDGRNVWAFPYWEYVDAGVMHSSYRDEQYIVYEYNGAYPRAFLASSYVVATDDREIIDTLFAPEFNRRDTLILEQKPLLEPEPGPASAKIVSYAPTKVSIETTSQTAKLLFLSDTYDAGWEATVDGKKSPVYRADYDFRAVAVPAGDHKVVFRYHPKEFRWGIILSVIGLGGLVVLLKHK